MEWLHVVLVCFSCVLLSSAVEDRVSVQFVELDPPSSTTVNSRIVGGVAANIEKYPFAVQLIRLNSLLCGGSLITARHVLTAAHCFYGQNGATINLRQVTVRAGTRHLNSGGATRTISMLVIHDRYNPNFHDNDIAVLVLSRSFTFNSTISQASLPLPNSYLYDNTTVWHIGWGAMWYGPNQAASPVLNEVQVFTINNAICAARYQELGGVVTSNNLCSGVLDVGGRDACQGDSGGPLVYNGYIVVGVTSWGEQCALARYPGVNMRTSAYTTWINNTVTRYNASPDTKASGVLLLTLLFTVIFSSKM